MSRSVQLLRTTFQDHGVWKPLMKMLHNASDEVLRLASSTLCNLLLEFSPSKEPILESGVVDMLVGLTRRDDQVPVQGKAPCTLYFFGFFIPM